jgi:hypothetical protein
MTAVILLLVCFATFFGGVFCCVCGALLYKIPVEYMQIVGNERRSGWQFGYLGFNIDIPPKIDNAVNFSTKVYDTGELQIPTPDDGILGVTASVVYMPDSRNIFKFANHTNVEKVLQDRVRREVHNWVNQQGVIGTLKKALIQQDSCEETVRAKLLSTPKEIAAIAHLDATYALTKGTPVAELGILIQEVNITQMRPLQQGTGQADYGDEPARPAEQLMQGLFHKAQDLSQMRQLRDQLLARYPEELEEIEDLYDDARMRIKDHRG